MSSARGSFPRKRTVELVAFSLAEAEVTSSSVEGAVAKLELPF